MVDIPQSSMVSTLLTDDSLGKKDEMDEEEDEIVVEEACEQSKARGVSFITL